MLKSLRDMRRQAGKRQEYENDMRGIREAESRQSVTQIRKELEESRRFRDNIQLDKIRVEEDLKQYTLRDLDRTNSTLVKFQLISLELDREKTTSTNSNEVSNSLIELNTALTNCLEVIKNANINNKELNLTSNLANNLKLNIESLEEVREHRNLNTGNAKVDIHTFNSYGDSHKYITNFYFKFNNTGEIEVLSARIE